MRLLHKSITWILLWHKLSFGCRWKNSTVILSILLIMVTSSINFIGYFLGTALSLRPRNLMALMCLSFGSPTYSLVGILNRTLTEHIGDMSPFHLLLMIRRFGLEKLIGIWNFHLSSFTDMSISSALIIIWIAVFRLLYLHGGFNYSVRCSIGSIIIIGVLCFHILLLPVIISWWATQSVFAIIV